MCKRTFIGAAIVFVLGTSTTQASFGFNEAPQYLTPQALDQARLAGAKVIRFPIAVSVLETQGWAPYDRVVSDVRAAGLRPEPNVADDRPQPSQVVAARCLEAVKRYGLDSIEVWNEPNLIGVVSPGRYRRMLKAARRIVPRSVKVIAAAPSPTVGNWRRYMIRVPGTIANVHVYPRAHPKRAAEQAVRQARKLTGSRRVRVTEVGALRSFYRSRQAWATRQLYRGLRAAERTIFHRLVQPVPGLAWEDRAQLGAITLDGQRTPIWTGLP